MNRLTKKAVSVGLSVTTAVWLSGAALLVPVASAQTIADLTAQINALLATIQQLQASLAVLQGGGAGVSVSCSFSQNLTLGSTGDDVKCLQQYLNSAGHQLAASGVGSPGSETSYFGPLTRAAVASWQAANSVSPSVGYFGPLSRGKYSSLVAAAPGVPGVPVPASGLALSLAAGNPLGVTVPKGATGVEFLRFNVAGSGTLDSIVFMRSGIGQTSDFGSSGFYLFEGGTRLTSGRSINSTTHEVGFFSLGLAVSGVRTFSLVADVASGAQAGDRNAFSLDRASGSSSPTGSFSGNEMEIGGTAVGQITATSGPAPSDPNVGQADALLAEFRLEANSTEDIDIMRIALTEGGSLPNDRLSGLELKHAGNVVATASAIGGKDLVVFEFDSPFLVEKGQQKTFQVFADISGASRTSDQVVFYFDSNSDINAIGRTFGFPVATVITGLDTTGEGDTLTVQGGRITITFNGPVAGDVARRLQDVLVYDFTIASQNNIEIRNLRFHATTTGLISGEGFNDFKVWDTGSNSVITSATDVTTSTDVTFTDVINVSAGESKRFNVTVDVDADNDDGDDITVSLLAFQSNDIRNLDNNTFVALADIVPNSTISGNVQDTRIAGLDIQLAGTPTSQTYVRGSQNIDLVGISFRAIADAIRLSSLKLTAATTTGQLGTGEVTNLALWDGTAQVSELESLSSGLTMTFDTGFNLTVPKGETKVLILRGNLDSNADSSDVYYFNLASLDTDLTAYDTDGNALASADKTGTTANSDNTVTVTVTNVGDATVIAAADDVESEAGIVLTNGERVLAKFKFETVNEAMTIDRFQLLINVSSSATATSSAAADEVSSVKLYEGGTLLGSSAGYPVTASGDDSGVVFIPEGFGWVIPKDGSKTLTVKGVMNTISGGADTGGSVFAHVQTTNFRAKGATANDETITAASGNEKIVYKSKPTLSLPTWTAPSLAAGTNAVFRFTVAASGNDDVSWEKVQLKVTMAGATMSSVGANPIGTSGNVQIRDLSTNTALNIGTAFSASATSGTTTSTIAGGNAGFVTIILNAEQTVAAGASKDYEISLTFVDLTSGTGNSTAALLLNLQETSKSAGSTVNGIETATEDGEPSFIWSDNSATGHSVSTSDWANGFRVKVLPSTSKTLSN